MGGSIIYPFRVGKNFQQGYAWSLELARRINFELIAFTVITGEITNAKKEIIYYALMAAQGHYWQHYTFTHRRASPKRKQKRIIIDTVLEDVESEFYNKFTDHIKSKNYSILAIIPDLFTKPEVNRWVISLNKPVLVLPQNDLSIKTNENGLNVTERFYEIFRQCEFYNIDRHIFDYLAKDKNLFNYLRFFFGKRK